MNNLVYSRRILALSCIFVVMLLFAACNNDTLITGSLNKWQPITLSFNGPELDEESSTFRDYRLNVTFTNGSESFTVPGFFAADGNAANTSASSGTVWQVVFAPNKTGEWNYSVSFRQGKDIAANNEPEAGEAVFFDGAKGSFTVNDILPNASGAYTKGKLLYVGERYLQYAETNEWFVKAGPGGPENYLGYIDFDSTFNVPGGINDSAMGSDGLHKYEPHLQHWQKGNPTWKDGKGKAIIGSVNYIANKGLNTFYLVINNVNGDGRDCWPWAGYNDRDIYDVSKLAQWDIVFKYMNEKGIHLDFLLWESENTKLLNDGNLGIERKIYYREMIARFGHLPAIRWNISEEPTTTPEQVLADAEYIYNVDPYGHAVGVHCGYTVERRNHEYPPLLNKPYFHGAWMQCHSDLHEEVKCWLDKSDSTGHKWVVSVDESLPNHPEDIDKVRREFWEVVTAGGEGFDVYFGYGTGTCDIANEDFANRDTSWTQLAGGLSLFNSIEVNTMLPEMKNHNELGNGYILAKPGEMYIIYLNGEKATLNLEGVDGKFIIQWLDPIKPGSLKKGNVDSVSGGEKVSLGSMPIEQTEWVVLVTKK